MTSNLACAGMAFRQLRYTTRAPRLYRNQFDLADDGKRIWRVARQSRRQDLAKKSKKRRRIFPRLLHEVILAASSRQRAEDHFLERPRDFVRNAARAPLASIAPRLLRCCQRSNTPILRASIPPEVGGEQDHTSPSSELRQAATSWVLRQICALIGRTDEHALPRLDHFLSAI